MPSGFPLPLLTLASGDCDVPILVGGGVKLETGLRVAAPSPSPESCCFDSFLDASSFFHVPPYPELGRQHYISSEQSSSEFRSYYAVSSVQAGDTAILCAHFKGLPGT